jgi:hypothetical protein
LDEISNSWFSLSNGRDESFPDLVGPLLNSWHNESESHKKTAKESQGADLSGGQQPFQGDQEGFNIKGST